MSYIDAFIAGVGFGLCCAGVNRVGKQTVWTRMASEEKIASPSLGYGAIAEASEEPMDVLPPLERLEQESEGTNQ